MKTYVLDIGAMVDLHSHFRRKFRRLKPMVQQGHVRIPEGVFRELHRKTDKLYKAVEQWPQASRDCVVQIGSVRNLADELVQIEKQYGERIVVGRTEYPGFWKSPSGTKAADGQVVAVAKVLGCTVVSDDRAVRLACMLEGVPCIGWTEFARQAGLSPFQRSFWELEEETRKSESPSRSTADTENHRPRRRSPARGRRRSGRPGTPRF